MDCSPPVSSVQGISQTRILKWVAISFSRGSSPPRGQTQVPCIADGFFTVGATREVQVQFSLKPSAVTDLALFEMTQRKPWPQTSWGRTLCFFGTLLCPWTRGQSLVCCRCSMHEWKNQPFLLCLGLHRDSCGRRVEARDTKQVVRWWDIPGNPWSRFLGGTRGYEPPNFQSIKARSCGHETPLEQKPE